MHSPGQARPPASTNAETSDLTTTPTGLPRRHLLGAALAGAASAWASPAAWAQPSYPNRPITLVVPFAPAGIADNTARTVAEAMAKTLGQPIVVDNRPSAGSIVATQAVATAKPDGHTLLLMSNSNAVSVGLFKKLPFNTTKDVVPVSTLGFFDLALFTSGNSRFTTIQQALQFAKAHPGELKLGTIAVGTTQHLAAKLLETVTGTSFLTVPYKSSPAVLLALRSGEIDLALEICGPMLSQVQAGAVKPLAVTGAQRNPALPDVPTLQQVGVAGYNVTSWNAIAVPAGTPPAVVQRLNQVIREAVASPQVSSKLVALGMRLEASSPEQAQQLLANDIKRWGEVIKAAKIEPE